MELTAGAAVPAMIILLGLELQKAEWTNNLKRSEHPGGLPPADWTDYRDSHGRPVGLNKMATRDVDH